MLKLLTPKNTIEEVLKSHTTAKQVLAGVHLPNCSSCMVRFDETLAEAAANYEFDLEDLLNRLNLVLLRHHIHQTRQSKPLRTWNHVKQQYALALYTEHL